VDCASLRAGTTERPTSTISRHEPPDARDVEGTASRSRMLIGSWFNVLVEALDPELRETRGIRTLRNVVRRHGNVGASCVFLYIKWVIQAKRLRFFQNSGDVCWYLLNDIVYKLCYATVLK